jgi:ParB-like nuclease domain
MPTLEISTRKTADLHFDRENPRLAEYGITSRTNENQILTTLWQVMDVRELVQSIAASGFFAHEPLMIVRENNQDVVIEGNRRLAAVKVLLNHDLVKSNNWDVPNLTAKAKELLEELPVIVSTRKDTWRYLGFKHVNGPAKWSSFAKAKYIAEVHDTFNVSLADIAEQIGDRHNTVQRLYRGLMVIEQAEKLKVFDRDDRYNTKFAFSHLYTGLDYDGITDFLKIKAEDEETDQPVPKAQKKQLGEVLLWMYGSKKDNKPPVVESQNPHLRQLNDALKSAEAVGALRAGADIGTAFQLSRPPEVVFEEALLSAKRELSTAQATITDGYSGSEELLRVAGSVVKMAEDLYTSMDLKRSPKKRERLTEES